jgi:hypothetical protein
VLGTAGKGATDCSMHQLTCPRAISTAHVSSVASRNSCRSGLLHNTGCAATRFKNTCTCQAAGRRSEPVPASAHLLCKLQKSSLRAQQSCCKCCLTGVCKLVGSNSYRQRFQRRHALPVWHVILHQLGISCGGLPATHAMTKICSPAVLSAGPL